MDKIRYKLVSFIKKEKVNIRNKNMITGWKDIKKWGRKTFKARVALRNYDEGKLTFWDFCNCCDKHKIFLIPEYVRRLGTNMCKKCFDLGMFY